MRPRIGITSSYSWRKEIFSLSEYYVKAVEKAGGIPYVIPARLDLDILDDIANLLDGLLLSGGGDIDPKHYSLDVFEDLSIEPGRDELEMRLVRIFLEKEKPIFAICRGIQILNVALGGSLHQEISKMTNVKHRWYDENGLQIPGWYPVHEVEIIEKTLLGDILGKRRVWVNSTHHQAVKDLGEGLKVNAVSKDGIIEGVEHTDHPFIVGVQWHPERMFEKYEDHFKLFRAFVKHASMEGERSSDSSRS